MRKYLVLLFMFLTMPVWAATYYITQAGSGSGDGSTYANSESVANHNADTFAADDIIYLCDTITSSVIPPTSGTSGHPITYRGDYAAHAGVIDGPTVGISFPGRSYLTFDGITVMNCYDGIKAYNASHDFVSYVTVNNCTIHDITLGTGSGAGIYIDGEGVTIYNCTIYNIGVDGIYTNGINLTVSYCNIYNVCTSGANGDCLQTGDHSVGYWIHHNTLDHSSSALKNCFINDNSHDVVGTGGVFEYNTCIAVDATGTHSAGYFRDHTNRQTVRNNTFTGGYYGVLIDGNVDCYNNYINGVYYAGIFINTSNQAGETINIWNNTIYDVASRGISVGNVALTANIVNNIISTCTTYGVINGAAGTVVADYNDVYANGTDYSGCSGGAHDFDADPLLTGYVIASGSPCKDTGTTEASVFNDIRGSVRPFNSVYDIGCFEYGALGAFTGTTTGGLH